jgi:hypothetical protein
MPGTPYPLMGRRWPTRSAPDLTGTSRLVTDRCDPRAGLAEGWAGRTLPRRAASYEPATISESG